MISILQRKENILTKSSKIKNENQVKTKNQFRKCYYYGKIGHLIKECFKKISDMKERNNSNGSAAIACKNAYDIQGVVLVSTIRRNPKEQVLESDCTFYMCPIRIWYSKFVELDG